MSRLMERTVVRIFLHPTFLVSRSAALSGILRSICFPPHWLHISCHHIPTSHCYQPAAIQSFCREQLAECDDRLFNGIRHNRSMSCTAFCRPPRTIRPATPSSRGAREGWLFPPLPISYGERCTLATWRPERSPGGNVAIYNVL